MLKKIFFCYFEFQLEELKQQWGEPLGLPPPPGDSIESAKTPAVAPKADATRTSALASARTSEFVV